jgi:uracil-DNA glycosylase
VLLLNRVLTVQPGHPASHRGKGWERVTDLAIATLVRRETPLVAILWGRDAQSVRPASRGFFGSRPFSRTNASLVSQGAGPVDWSLP